MGLFNRASRHSGGSGGGLGPATAGREPSADADLGAELAELGELVPEREEEVAPPEGSDPSPTAHTWEPQVDELEDEAPEAEADTQTEPAPDVIEELEAAEEAGSSVSDVVVEDAEVKVEPAK